MAIVASQLQIFIFNSSRIVIIIFSLHIIFRSFFRSLCFSAFGWCNCQLCASERVLYAGFLTRLVWLYVCVFKMNSLCRLQLLLNLMVILSSLFAPLARSFLPAGISYFICLRSCITSSFHCCFQRAFYLPFYIFFLTHSPSPPFTIHTVLHSKIIRIMCIIAASPYGNRFVFSSSSSIVQFLWLSFVCYSIAVSF